MVLKWWNELCQPHFASQFYYQYQHFFHIPTWTLSPIFPTSLLEIHKFKQGRILRSHFPTKGLPLRLGNFWEGVQSKLIIRLHWICSAWAFIFSTWHSYAVVWHLLIDQLIQHIWEDFSCAPCSIIVSATNGKAKKKSKTRNLILQEREIYLEKIRMSYIEGPFTQAFKFWQGDSLTWHQKQDF